MLIIINGLPVIWSINQWSVAYLGQRLVVNSTKTTLLLNPPEKHAHSSIWLAGELVEGGEKHDALTILRPFIVSKNKLALSVLGDIHQRNGNFPLALKTWIQIGDYQSAIQSAEKANINGKTDIAELAYQEIWNVYPELSALNYANFLWDQKNYETAEKILRQALTQFPHAYESLKWQRRLILILREQERWDDAFSFAKEVTDQYPEDWQSLIYLGWIIYESGGGLEATEVEFKKAINQAPNRGDGYYAMGKVLTNEGFYDEANQWFDEAIARNPNEHSWYITSGFNLRADSQFEQALRIYQIASKRFPESAQIYYEMAWVFVELEQLENAQISINKALDMISPQNPWYYFRAGQIYEKLGTIDLAIEAYQNVLILDPTFEPANTRLTQLGINP